ncbi:O-acetylhomoserine aminocarboxypropyltransferase/cysteine synthase [Arcanobacterium haemolyticum]|nr:O-acetylhomoserine aminocarboxypropyltransferase/cysteine synthase [Arcanobacterium haemolyticum]
MTNPDWSFDTNQIHAGQKLDSDYGARALPIYQTTSFVFDSAEDAEERFTLMDPGQIYSRMTNPTTAAIEERIATLEGGSAGLLVASGQAASFYTFTNLAQAGHNIVASPSLYGGTVNLLNTTIKQFGIEVRFVDNPDDPQSWYDLVDDNTRALFGESIPNPKSDILDIETLAQIAHSHGIPLVVDNTIGTPYTVRPFEHGADIVIASATKFLGGHGTSVGGVIVERGDFPWDNGKFPLLGAPDPHFGGASFASITGKALTSRIRNTSLRDTGACISPFNAFLIGLGLETLSLRVERHLSNARTIAEFLDKQDEVELVRYASLVSSPYYELAQKYTPKGAGSVFTFDLKGGKEAALAFINGLTLFSNLVNIGDVRSLAVHPATTTHAQESAEEKAAGGITDGTIRLSVGTEDVTDLISDLTHALAAAHDATSTTRA